MEIFRDGCTINEALEKVTSEMAKTQSSVHSWLEIATAKGLVKKIGERNPTGNGRGAKQDVYITV